MKLSYDSSTITISPSFETSGAGQPQGPELVILVNKGALTHHAMDQESSKATASMREFFWVTRKIRNHEPTSCLKRHETPIARAEFERCNNLAKGDITSFSGREAIAALTRNLSQLQPVLMKPRSTARSLCCAPANAALSRNIMQYLFLSC